MDRLTYLKVQRQDQVQAWSDQSSGSVALYSSEYEVFVLVFVFHRIGFPPDWAVCSNGKIMLSCLWKLEIGKTSLQLCTHGIKDLLF